MTGLLVVLVLVGVGLYLLTLIPMDAAILTIIRVVVILACVLYVLSAFGVLDVPIPRVHR